MNPDHYRRQIQSSQKKVSDLQSSKAREVKRIADLQRRIGSASQAANRSSSTSTISSKIREIERLERDVANVQKKIGDGENKIASEMKRLADYQKRLAQEEERVFRKRAQDEKRRQRQSDQQLGAMSRQLADHETAIQDLSKLPEKITILFIASNPLDQNSLRLDEEVRMVEEMIRKSDHRDSLELRSHWAARPLDLIQKINEMKPTVLHISGHGSASEELVFQDDDGNSKLVSKEAFVQTITATTDSLKLLFLNSCHSCGQAEAASQSIPAAIGMQDAIGDDTARTFAASFYGSIGFGHDLYQAFNQGKAALMLEGIPEENIPIIFSRSDIDPACFHLIQPAD